MNQTNICANAKWTTFWSLKDAIDEEIKSKKVCKMNQLKLFESSNFLTEETTSGLPQKINTPLVSSPSISNSLNSANYYNEKESGSVIDKFIFCSSKYEESMKANYSNANK